MTIAVTTVFLSVADYGGQNPMRVKTADRDASPPHPTSLRSATFPSKGKAQEERVNQCLPLEGAECRWRSNSADRAADPATAFPYEGKAVCEAARSGPGLDLHRRSIQRRPLPSEALRGEASGGSPLRGSLYTADNCPAARSRAGSPLSPIRHDAFGFPSCNPPSRML